MGLNDFLSAQRRKPSSVSGRDLTEELASDRSRILYTPPFRRLAKKAQVFSLESNAAVRNRIIHSLEVSDTGRWIAFEITRELINQRQIDPALQLPIIYAVENACFLHDIGNPPFGHFGEAAIQDWFTKRWEDCYKASASPGDSEVARMAELIEDFKQFDGNPQGVRMILRRRDRDQYGLNLTYTTILSLIKYVRSPAETASDDLTKKPGYFESEKATVLQLKAELGMKSNARFPLAYIMEAADDIAYCISDIEDGIEKGIITTGQFFDELEAEWTNDDWNQSRTSNTFPIGDLRKSADDKLRLFYFKTSYTRQSIQKAKERFLGNFAALLEGRVGSLFPANSEEAQAFKCLKRIARRRLFRSPEAENPELAGYQIVTGLLEKLSHLLRLSAAQFEKLLEGRTDPSKLSGQGLDYYWRLFNKLPKNHLAVYEDLVNEFAAADFPEWYFRAHLVTDYVSGMTDGYALELYQLLNGIRLAQEW